MVAKSKNRSKKQSTTATKASRYNPSEDVPSMSESASDASHSEHNSSSGSDSDSAQQVVKKTRGKRPVSSKKGKKSIAVKSEPKAAKSKGSKTASQLIKIPRIPKTVPKFMPLYFDWLGEQHGQSYEEHIEHIENNWADFCATFPPAATTASKKGAGKKAAGKKAAGAKGQKKKKDVSERAEPATPPSAAPFDMEQSEQERTGDALRQQLDNPMKEIEQLLRSDDPSATQIVKDLANAYPGSMSLLSGDTASNTSTETNDNKSNTKPTRKEGEFILVMPEDEAKQYKSKADEVHSDFVSKRDQVESLSYQEAYQYVEDLYSITDKVFDTINNNNNNNINNIEANNDMDCKSIDDEE